MSYWTCRPQLSSHPHQVGERIGLHLLHDAPSVRFDRDLADAELAADLLIQQAGHNERHYLLFPVSKGGVTVAKFLYLRGLSEGETVSFQGFSDSTHQNVVIKRLG